MMCHFAFHTRQVLNMMQMWSRRSTKLTVQMLTEKLKNVKKVRPGERRHGQRVFERQWQTHGDGRGVRTPNSRRGPTAWRMAPW